MQISRRHLIAAATLVLFSTGASGVYAQERFEREPLTISHQDGRTSDFDVELAITPAQKSQGLMYRRTMAPEKGMLFDFQEDRLVTMWMRNTYLPLDMIFMSKDGKVTHIHENAVPHDESVISSRGDVRFVLELIAGSARHHKIKIGDKAASPQIEKAAQ